MSRLTEDEQAKHVEAMMTPELQTLAKMIDEQLPEGWGFGLMIFELGAPDGGPLLWVSNAERSSMIKVMKEYIAKRGG